MKQKTVETTYDIGKPFTLSGYQECEFQEPELSDYEFTHWTSSQVDVEPYYQDKQKNVKFYQNQVDLYAQWEKTWFKFTYDKNMETPKLYFEAGEPNSTIKLTNVAGTYKTSTNGTDWTYYRRNTLCTLTNVGDRIYFSARDKNETCWNNDYDNPKFIMTGKIGAHGNIQYLLDSTGECLSVPVSCYYCMFSDCSSLTSAPELPATELAKECYFCMFYNCTSLSIAENDSSYGYLMLSAPQTIASYWGDYMFYGTAGTFTGIPTSLSCYYCHVN